MNRTPFRLLAIFSAVLATAACESTDTESDGTSIPEPGAPVVLVHGAWMGAWAWDEVVPLLEAAGHPTTVVELPAHGADTTAASAATLASYRDAVVAALDAQTEPAILVGHSMGGIVISEAAEARPAKIATSVYVAAFLPRTGQSLFALGSSDTGSQTAAHLVMNGDGTVSIDPSAMGAAFCADCSPAEIDNLLARTRPEPIAPLTTPVTLTDGAFGTVRRVYVRTEADQAVSVGAQDAMIAATGVADQRTLAASHCPFFSQPEALVDAILDMTKEP